MESLSPHQNEDVIIGENWVLFKRIGKGGFGEVYLGKNIKTGEEVAIKVEESNAPLPLLEHEGKVYGRLQGVVGIPNIPWCGAWNNFNVIVMELLGSSLEDLFNLCGRRFSLKTALLIGDQIMSRVESVHRKGFIHRDIKPHNFLIGTARNKDKVYIIDFGLAKAKESLIDSGISGNVGSVRFCSLKSHLTEQSERDDLESVGYLMVYFIKGSLPWHNVTASTRKQLSERIFEMKMSISVDFLCQGCPDELKAFITYCRSLEFKAEPDYLNLRHSLREAMRKVYPNFIYGNAFEYDWLLLSKADLTSDKDVVPVELQDTKENMGDLQPLAEKQIKLRRSSRIQEAGSAMYDAQNTCSAPKRMKPT